MADGDTSIRKGRKFDQVLDGARAIFLADGFEGASVDAIAREAGVSKATLYSYFPDKKQLFMEVAKRECSRMADSALEVIDMANDPRVVLTEAGTRIVRFVLSDFAQRVFRICVAEADRFPDLGKVFYENGPELGKQRLKAYFADAVSRGYLKIDDADLAAEQFGDLCKSVLWHRAVFGIQREFSDAEIARTVHGAVETFVARYGV